MFRKLFVPVAVAAAMTVGAAGASAAEIPTLTPTQAAKAGEPSATKKVLLNGELVPAGGVQVGNDTIVYTGGTSGIVVKPASQGFTTLAASDCPSAAMCLFQHNNFNANGGRYWWGSGYNVNYSLGAYDFNDLASSWINRRSGHSRAFQNGIDSTPSLVLYTGSSTQLSSSWNDEISSIRVGTN